VAQILHDLNYSLQSNRKTEEGADHPDRDAQFRHINAAVSKSIEQGLPVISVDTKKKELIGNYANGGQQWLAAKEPIKVQGHDFPNPEIPRAYPYGIYDIARNAGFVNVGTDHDTGEFAVASIRGWWRHEGKKLYPDATKLLNYKTLPMRQDYLFQFATFHQEQANGTRLSIGCSPSSHQTGAGSR